MSVYVPVYYCVRVWVCARLNVCACAHVCMSVSVRIFVRASTSCKERVGEGAPWVALAMPFWTSKVRLHREHAYI